MAGSSADPTPVLEWSALGLLLLVLAVAATAAGAANGWALASVLVLGGGALAFGLLARRQLHGVRDDQELALLDLRARLRRLDEEFHRSTPLAAPARTGGSTGTTTGIRIAACLPTAELQRLLTRSSASPMV